MDWLGTRPGTWKAQYIYRWPKMETVSYVVASIDADVCCDVEVDQHSDLFVLEVQLFLRWQRNDGPVERRYSVFWLVVTTRDG